MSSAGQHPAPFIPFGMLDEAIDSAEAHAISLRIIGRALVQIESLSAWVEQRKGCEIDHTEVLEQLDMVADQIRAGLNLVRSIEVLQAIQEAA